MNSSEKLNEHREIEAIFEDIMACDPEPIVSSKASNYEEQKELFLNGIIQNPEFSYDLLAEIDYVAQETKLINLIEEVKAHPLIPEKHLKVYLAFINRYLGMLKLMQHANGFNLSDNPEQREMHRVEFMKLNKELYGEPDQDTFVSLLSEKIKRIRSFTLSDSAKPILQELESILRSFDFNNVAERYKPSQHTINKVSAIANILYGSLIDHVDETIGSYSPEEVRDLFEEIIAEEFCEAAEGWQVIVDDSTSINVVPSKKIIKIPFNRKPIKPQEMRGLVAHELGVHFMRAVMGSETDMLPLGLGFAGYYDAEEGLGKVMEQGIKGKYIDSGIPYYIVSGLMANGMDFREVHDVMWRIKVLEKLATSQEATEAVISSAKADSFKTVFRIARLTNGLPWFKDLSYFNGSVSMWQYLDNYADDFEKFIALFYGKIDPSNPEHERDAYEARSI